MGKPLIGQSEDVSTDDHARCSLRASCRNEHIIVVANREPFRHDYDAHRGIVATHSHSGVVHAVEPLLTACSGVWVAHGAGTADRASARHRDGVDVPPEHPAYRLRRVWLNQAEERGYYDGFANEGLWPLCHRAYVKPIFRGDDFRTYQTVNRRFADAACEEAVGDSPLVLVQDYHLALVPRLIRERLPGSVVVAFWHIPWPHWEDFEVCPWGYDILRGLLGSSIVGFQTPTDSAHFIETVERRLGAPIDRARHVIAYANRRVLVRTYPASIEWPNPWALCSPPVETCRRDVRQGLQVPAHVRLGVAVDRMDYTKGLEEKFAAIERVFDCYPAFRDTFAFVQLAQPTRARLPAYRELRPRLMLAVDRINRRFGSASHRRITLLEGDHVPEDVFRYLRAADLCYVASLQDGMNLVSKEFVSAKEDERGVLILSKFAGAASELRDALLVNPWDIDGTADVLAQALCMSEAEQRQRMRRMRSLVAHSSAYRWAEQMVADALRLRHAGAPRGSTASPVQVRVPSPTRRSPVLAARAYAADQ